MNKLEELKSIGKEYGKLYLNASDIAAASGLNRFKTQEDILKKIFLRKEYKKNVAISKEKLSNNINSTNIKTDNEIMNNVININKNEINLIVNNETSTRENQIKELSNKAVEDYKNTSINSLQKNINPIYKSIISNNIEESIKNLNKYKEEQIKNKKDTLKTENIIKHIQEINSKSKEKDIKEDIKSEINKSCGIKKESQIINELKNSGREIINSNSKIYYITENTTPIEIIIGGKVDGWIQDKNIIQEIKSRTNRLFKKVYEYENIQIQTYLKMTNAKYCHLTEQYQNEMWDTTIYLDNKLWDEKVIPGLQTFIKKYIEIYSNEDLFMNCIK